MYLATTWPRKFWQGYFDEYVQSHIIGICKLVCMCTVYCIGRHLLHREEPDNHVTGSNVTATSEVEGNLHATEAIASALAAAVLDKEESSSLESEEEYQCPAPMGSQEQHAVHSVPVEDCAMVPATSTDAAYREERNGATSGQSPPHTDEASSVEQRLEEKHLKLKSGKKRMMHRDESTACDAVQDACLGREAITIEVLLGLLQDPDHGAHRAQVNKDVLIRKGGSLHRLLCMMCIQVCSMTVYNSWLIV